MCHLCPSVTISYSKCHSKLPYIHTVGNFFLSYLLLTRVTSPCWINVNEAKQKILSLDRFCVGTLREIPCPFAGEE